MTGRFLSGNIMLANSVGASNEHLTQTNVLAKRLIRGIARNWALTTDVVRMGRHDSPFACEAGVSK